MTKINLLRKSVAAIIVVAMLLLSYIPIAAEEEVSLSFIDKDIYLNGVLVNNYELNYPLVTRDDRTYLPLTQEIGTALGFQFLIDPNQQLIQLQKTEASYGTVKNGDLACNLQDQAGLLMDDYVLAAVTEFGTQEAESLSAKWRQMMNPVIWSLAGLVSAITNETIDPTPNTEVFRLGEDEILIVDEVTYVPLSAFRDSRMFEWDAYYDALTGLYISTDSNVPAQSFYSQSNASYIEGRAAYIRSIRPELSVSDSYYYEYIFRHEANVYDVDQELLMAISRTECSFQARIVGGGGAVGMMQIMPKTAIAYQITELQLKDPHINVEFGTRYIRDRLWIFDGDVIKALSAYNQGVQTVSTGIYKTGYADKCVYNESVLEAWLTERGYSNTFLAKLPSAAVKAADPQAETQPFALQSYQ